MIGLFVLLLLMLRVLDANTYLTLTKLNFQYEEREEEEEGGYYKRHEYQGAEFKLISVDSFTVNYLLF
jgi:hypothetical protein